MTSQTRSNKRRRSLVAFAFLSAIALASCTHASAPPEIAATPPPALPANAPVGYVRMDELVHRHPLAAQLAHLDEDIDALRLSAAGSEVAAASADLLRERDRLTRELDGATKHARAVLASDRAEEQRREQGAIASALAASDAAYGRSGAEITAAVQATYAQQAKDVARTEASNFATYRSETIAQAASAEAGLARALRDRAARIVRARADRFAQAEAAEALRLASMGATERLQIRTRLVNLALSDGERAALRDRLAALDRAEGDALGAMRNRDARALADLRSSVSTSTRAEYGRDVAELRARTARKLGIQAASARGGIASIGPLDLGPPAVTQRTALPPSLRGTIERLHATFAADFARDADRTVRELTATREDLARRFTRLHVADAAAQRSARAEEARLAGQRKELAAEIVAQIDRETQAVARRRGIRVVLGGIVAAPQGTDLTRDVEKDIEKLHE